VARTQPPDPSKPAGRINLLASKAELPTTAAAFMRRYAPYASPNTFNQSNVAPATRAEVQDAVAEHMCPNVASTWLWPPQSVQGLARSGGPLRKLAQGGTTGGWMSMEDATALMALVAEDGALAEELLARIAAEAACPDRRVTITGEDIVVQPVTVCSAGGLVRICGTGPETSLLTAALADVAGRAEDPPKGESLAHRAIATGRGFLAANDPWRDIGQFACALELARLRHVGLTCRVLLELLRRRWGPDDDCGFVDLAEGVLAEEWGAVAAGPAKCTKAACGLRQYCDLLMATAAAGSRKWDEAKRRLRGLVKSARQLGPLGPEYWQLRASLELGLVQREMGHLAGAMAVLEKVCNALDHAGPDPNSHLGLLSVHAKIGLAKTLKNSGRFGEALGILSIHLHPGHVLEPWFLVERADVNRQAHCYLEMNRDLQKALPTLRGERQMDELARAERRQAVLFREVGLWEEAQAGFLSALRSFGNLSPELRPPAGRQEAILLSSYGQLLTALSRPEHARTCFGLAWPVLEHSRYDQALLLDRIGELSRVCGDTERAARLQTDALGGWEALAKAGAPADFRVFATKLHLSESLLQAGRTADARQHADHCLAMCPGLRRAAPGSSDGPVAESHLQLARVAAAEGQCDDARNHLKEARSALWPLGEASVGDPLVLRLRSEYELVEGGVHLRAAGDAEALAAYARSIEQLDPLFAWAREELLKDAPAHELGVALKRAVLRRVLAQIDQATTASPPWVGVQADDLVRRLCDAVTGVAAGNGCVGQDLNQLCGLLTNSHAPLSLEDHYGVTVGGSALFRGDGQAD